MVKLAQELGGRIRVARLRRKIRQPDMAERTGLSRSTIESFERGEVTCSIGVSGWIHFIFAVSGMSPFEILRVVSCLFL